MPNLFVGTDYKAGRLLDAERTEPLPVSSSAFELHVLTDDILDRQSRLDFFNSIHMRLVYDLWPPLYSFAHRRYMSKVTIEDVVSLMVK